jgi:RimJ/RimL family protein N-acetyltransferase
LLFATGDYCLNALHVYELPMAKFHLAAPLLHQAWFDEAYIDMVLEGTSQPGRIFVDRLENPSAAMLCHPYEFYVAGDSSPKNPLRQFIKDNPAEPDIFHTLYGYCGVGAAWEKALLEDSGGLLEVIPRRNFKFRLSAPRVDWRANLPPFAALQRMDAALSEQVDRDFQRRISRDWGVRALFLERSFGFCLLIDGQIASLVDVSGISSQYTNLSVETIEPYRRLGYAMLVSAACIEHSLERGLMPTWDCDGPNLASAALALKLGFEEDRPFSQLSPHAYGKLPLSQGRWNKAGVEEGIVDWIKVQ